MLECRDCGSESRHEGGLCPSCYDKEPVNQQSESLVTPSDDYQKNGISTSLTDKERNYRYNMIKGRIAETLIQELFLSLGYKVFSYGMEKTIPGIMELMKGVMSEVAQEIRSMPDFVFQNPRTKAVHLVEVKFRKNGNFSLSSLPKNYPFHNALFILVSKKHIKCISYKELKAGQEITPSSKNYLFTRKEFDLDKKVIIDFCDFAIQFFKSV